MWIFLILPLLLSVMVLVMTIGYLLMVFLGGALLLVGGGATIFSIVNIFDERAPPTGSDFEINSNVIVFKSWKFGQRKVAVIDKNETRKTAVGDRK